MAEKTPAAAPSETGLRPHEIELQRKMALLRKVRVQRESLANSMAQVDGKDPAMHYSWINRHESRMTWFAGQGYVVVTDPKIKTSWKREDGTHVRGDLILVARPKDLHEAWKYDAELRAVEDLESSRDSFKAFAGRNGIPVEEPRI